ncbi:ImmA/IrrE family metallo-endopeptidase [Salmonella enterica]|nr:ImmA/IrrE family metallo-endopeptidase [Salmonella enterica]EIE2769401.1 ImmA/IrrE family metallo-endopeptidase [Salmonella enterica subsp. enterica serovar Rubislaw]HBJ6961123.1 ImmA/IrrE family metallo-endopeptidase [Salmonella enterica subsp. enterica serovar Duisburg]EAU0146536.1 ImmA/IrrE family metallo-endopeptidase [Salmonella enterica]EAX2706323.1 ImmA/IrrE family metallo-endopeptidase [Salmonella enterica]
MIGRKMEINPERLKLARLRRKMTYSALAAATGLSSKSVAEYEKYDSLFSPSEHTLSILANTLGYPVSFFYGKDVDFVDPSTVSFRSLKNLKAAEQHAAEAAGSLGVMINNYFENVFNLPCMNIPNLRDSEPEVAAEIVREKWGLGVKSISNMVHLLEANGVRVFSLAENTLDVDAFSFWKNDTPYVFLNTQKTGERSRFDAAHELGHLVLHRHGSPQGKSAEEEADNFASAFLMPKRTILATKMAFPTLDGIISIKGNWLVSSVALIVRMKNVGILTEWQYRSLMVEATKRGLRKSEVNGIAREKSLVIDKLLASLKKEGIGISGLSTMLSIPTDELTHLLFKLTVINGDGINTGRSNNKPSLKLV